MESLLPLISNLSLPWTWLAGHINAGSNPKTIHVFCYGICAANALLQTFSARPVPWLYHYNATELTPVLISDTVLILCDSSENAERAITTVASYPNAYRARYFLVHYSYVHEQVIQRFVSLAWKSGLTQTVALGLQDRTIYSVQPKCQGPRIIKVGTVKWPSLRRLRLENCTLRVAAFYLPPFTVFKENDSAITGIYKPFYQYVQKGLNFQGLLTNTPSLSLFPSILSGRVDLSFSAQIFTPYKEVELTYLQLTKLTWCVPDFCVLGPTSYFLWREFSATTWMLLAVSLFSVYLSVYRLALPKSITLTDSLFRALSSLASVSVKLPTGHARCVYAVWLMAVLVLGTCYQTALHSMMAAPAVVHRIADTVALSKSQIILLCSTATCNYLHSLGKGDMVATQLAARAEQVDGDSGYVFAKEHQDFHSMFTLDYICKIYFTGTTALDDERSYPVYVGMVGVAPSSWLAPALRRLASQADAFGLTGLWYRRDVKKLSCSNSKQRDLQAITIELLWPALLLMCAGFTIALVVFFIELSWYRWKQKTNKKKNIIWA